MATTRIVGEGRCPKCGGMTQVKHIESFPFPEEENSRVVETCASCDFDLEKDFSSTNAHTSMDHENARDLMKRRVALAISSLRELIAAYPTAFVRPDISGVTTAMKPLDRGDFSCFYVELEKLAKSPLAEVRFDSMAEIRSAAAADGRSMNEWHENEARVEARDQQPAEKVFDAVAALVRLAEKNIKAQK